MPIWTVEGADRNSGKDVIISIDAPSEELAGQEATARGIVISDVHHSAADGPAKDKPAPAYAPGIVAPEYKDIVHGSRTLKSIGDLIAVLGWIAIGLGALILIVAVVATIMAMKSHSVTNITGLIPIGLSLIISGVPPLILAAILRMLASLAIAVRDMTINSFKG